MSRIAVLTPYAQPVVGGISSFVAGLEAALRTRGNEVVVMSGHGAGDKEGHSNLGQGSVYSNRASALLSQLTPDVVHCHSHRAMLAAGVRYKQEHPEARLVFSFHTTPRIRVGSPVGRLLRSADVVTFVSSVQMKELRATLGLNGNLRVLRPAVQVRTVDRGGVRDWMGEHGIVPGFPLLSFIGPLEYPRKVRGVIDLVASLPALRTEFPFAQLIVVGDGTLRPRVVTAASKRGVAVTITGFVDRPELALAATDIYCHISYQEGLPMALLEAMAAGCPVIASETGGIPEVIDGTNGILVEPGTKPIVDAVRVLASDEGARRRMGSAARTTIQASYTWDKRIPEVYAAYEIEGGV